MSAPLVLAIDQGTGSTKCLLVDRQGAIVADCSVAIGQSHPETGWVEQDGAEIWSSVLAAIRGCCERAGNPDVAAIGISNQRESIIAWDRRSGAPLSPVLSWQDQRSAAICAALREAGAAPLVRERSGLPLDPMFSAAKAKWLLDRIDPDRVRSKAGEIVIGTIDSFLLSRLSAEPLIEAGNASRTQLMATGRGAWDEDLLKLFSVPVAALPRIVASTGPFPGTRSLAPLKDGTPVMAVMGDSHAALFAHGAFAPGVVKATYGTGTSVMGLIGDLQQLDPGLCLTIAWQLERPVFAAEGNIRSSGSTLRWLADVLGLSVDELASLAAGSRNEGVSLVPGFNGLGAPWWDDGAVGLLSGVKLGTGRGAMARAAFESIPHQIADVVEAVDRSVGQVKVLQADGGAARNPFLMQLQADLLGRTIQRAHAAELSALGAAHLAGHAAGLWSFADLAALSRPQDRFMPQMTETVRNRERLQWRDAVARARGRA